jgi:hypothetical protein
MRRRLAQLGLFAALVVSACWPAAAHARSRPKEDAGDEQEAPKKLAIHIEGKNAAALRDQISAIAPEGVDTIDNAEFDKAIRASGLPPALGMNIVSPGARRVVLPRLQKAMEKTGADAAVIGLEIFYGKHQLAFIYLVKGASDVAFEDKIDLGTSDNAQRKALKKEFEGLFADLAPPPPPPPPPPPEKTEEELAAEREAEEAKKRAFRPNTPGGELVAVRAGFQDGFRWFDYDNPVTSNTRPYKIAGPAGLGVGLEVYPAAMTDIVVLRDIGLFVDYGQFFGVRSETKSDGPTAARGFSGTWNRLDTGLRFRLRLGAPRKPFVIGLSGGYGFQNFVFTADDDFSDQITNQIASVRYRYLRAGLDARLPVAFVAFLPSFSYLGPLAPAGDTVYARFTGPSVKGIEVGLDIAFVLPLGFEVRAPGVAYTRYFASFDAQPGDAYRADGAVDQYLALRGALVYRY